ncbi:MAG: hypothetical protein ACRETR_09915 [Steroidobacteraceae bacterium]
MLHGIELVGRSLERIGQHPRGPGRPEVERILIRGREGPCRRARRAARPWGSTRFADDAVQAHCNFELVDEDAIAILERPPLELRQHGLR